MHTVCDRAQAPVGGIVWVLWKAVWVNEDFIAMFFAQILLTKLLGGE